MVYVIGEHVFVYKQSTVVGIEQRKADPCVSWLIADTRVELMLCVHVDDIVIGRSQEACNS